MNTTGCLSLVLSASALVARLIALVVAGRGDDIKPLFRKADGDGT
jgi:hypothetical protein